MYHLLTTCRLCGASSVAFSYCRGFRTNAVVRRRKIFIPVPGAQGKLMKDSSFVDTEEEPETLHFREDVFDRAYGEILSEEKAKRSRQRKMFVKKKIENQPPDPNMLTCSEREHMKFLHKSDPYEWSAEKLSESFPALPRVIKKILKQQWSVESVEKMKVKDKTVLENWEKFKKNELVASPELLKHLEKFTDRESNLKTQLENPKFFPVPETKKELPLKGGPLAFNLEKYGEIIEKFRKERRANLLPSGNEGSDVMISPNQNHYNTIEEEIEIEKKLQNITDEDSFLIGKNSKSSMVTLDKLKSKVFKKAEQNRTLNVFERDIINKTLGSANTPHNPIQWGMNSDDKIKTLKMPKQEINIEKEKRSDVKVPEIEKKVSSKGMKAKELELEDERIFEYEQKSMVKHNDLGLFLQKLKANDDPTLQENGEKTSSDGEVPSDIKPKKVKTPVNYYNTEKDRSIVERDVKILSETCFWKSEEQPVRTKSKDAGSVMGTVPSPHLSGEIVTYVTYDYPEKITIPKGEWVKGKTYKVNDCFYDDRGVFLYRVPGIE